jgi:hypothetical protein
MTDTKLCPQCGKTFTRNSKEQGPKAWARRIHCSTSCAGTVKRKLVGKPKQDPRPQEGHRCECGSGAPATKTIHFHIMPVEYRALIESTLQVCADCHQYMIENDPGAW